jgi:hypothetical protein
MKKRSSANNALGGPGRSAPHRGQGAHLGGAHVGKTQPVLSQPKEGSAQLNLLDERLRRPSELKSSPSVLVRLSPAVPTALYETYWKFAAERQAIFFRRFEHNKPPWSIDPIFQTFKFTNAYRAADRVSQYLIRNVIYQGEQSPNELFFRILLFKVFNRIDTWERLVKHFGEVRYSDYSFVEYDRVLESAIGNGSRIYSAAYIMPTGGKGTSESRKHRLHLKLIDRMIADHLPERLTNLRRMADAFAMLRSYPTIGDFLAYQFTTDLNYSTLTDFSESEFVVPGPGAREGIRKCFSSLGGLTEPDIIRFIADRQEEEFSNFEIKFDSLWGRRLQYIDCQNLFCEVAKYTRVAFPDIVGSTGRTRIKQRFVPTTADVEYMFPPKWNLESVAE